MSPQGATRMAEYSRWMNERMFLAAARLGDEELAADKGAFFGSVLGTLNHIAAADTIWLHRFARHPMSFAALGALCAFPRPTSLRQALAADLEGLHAYRRELDGLIVRWVSEISPEHLASPLAYTNMAGVEAKKNFGAVLQHFFNHQTHHRGQVSTLLFQSGVDVGVTDLLALIPDGEV